MQIEELLRDYKNAFNLFLDEFLKLDDNFLNLKHKDVSACLFNAIEYSIQNGGKRLRPILSLLSAEAVKLSPEMIPIALNPSSSLALAVELLHCGSLIHDDLPCLDNDELRRGKPTTHIEFGEDTALLAGDFLLSYPIEIILVSDHDADIKNLAAIEFSRAISSMVIGQCIDMKLMNKTHQNIDEVSFMQELKTGALIEASITVSARLAGADEMTIDGLKNFAKKLGLVFQIIDDVLDYISDAQTLGKKAGKDFTQNKHSFVKEYGVEGSKQLAKSIIEEAKLKLDSLKIYPDKLKLVADYVISRIN